MFCRICSLRSSRIGVQELRASSAWISSPKKGKIDYESKFIEPEVQALLYKLTGLNLYGKIFRERVLEKQERSHYALMTDKMFADSVERMRERGRQFLQFVPFKEPRVNSFNVLAKDGEVAEFDQCRYVFTDISFDATNKDRVVIVREVDGTLRTAFPEEHDRMNRVFYDQPDRPIVAPAVFSDTHLVSALNRGQHEFVLDWACYFYEPDDPTYVKICRQVFDRVINDNTFDFLSSTRHFGTLAFYMIINNNLKPLIHYFGDSGNVAGIADLIRTQKLIFRDWRTAVSADDTDEKVIRDFADLNKEFKTYLLNALAKSKETPRSDEYLSRELTHNFPTCLNIAKITAGNLGTEDGPLGRDSSLYSVRLGRRGDKQSNKKGKLQRTEKKKD